MTDNKPAERKERDVDSIVRYLTNTFNSAISKLEKPHRSTVTGKSNLAYQAQTEFAYRLNEVMLGSSGALQRNITECNSYIDYMMQRVANGDK